MTIRPLVALVRKDLLLFFRDRRAVVVAFVVPLATASSLALLVGDAPAGGAGERPWVCVVDLDRGELSARVASAFDRDDSVLVIRGADEDEARAEVRGGSAAATVVIPRGFGAGVAAGDGPRPELVVLHDRAHGTEAAMVRALLARHVLEAIDVGRRPAEPFATRDELIVGDGEGTAAAMARVFGGMAVPFPLLAAIEAGLGLLNERRLGLWKRLRAAPLARWTLLVARGASGMFIATMILASLLALGMAAFGLRVSGSPVGLGLVGLSYAACAASLGLVIATIGRTPQAARGLSAVVVLLMAMLGGAWVPTSAFPDWLRRLAPLIPTRWAVDGLEGALARGLSLAGLMPDVLALVAFSATFLALAAWRFRWEE